MFNSKLKFKCIALFGFLSFLFPNFSIFAESNEDEVKAPVKPASLYFSTGKLDSNSGTQSNALQLINSNFIGNRVLESTGNYRWFNDKINVGLDNKMTGSISKIGILRDRTKTYSDDLYLEIANLSSNPFQLSKQDTGFVITSSSNPAVFIGSSVGLSPINATQTMRNLGYKGKFMPFANNPWLQNLGLNIGAELNYTYFNGENNLILASSSSSGFISGQNFSASSTGAGLRSRNITHSEIAILGILGFSYKYPIIKDGTIQFSYDFLRTFAPISSSFEDKTTTLSRDIDIESYSGNTSIKIEGNRFSLGYSHAINENFKIGIRYGLEKTTRSIDSASIKYKPGIPLLLTTNFLFDTIARDVNTAFGPLPSSADTRQSIIIEAVLLY